MKRIISIILIAILLMLTLCSCAKKENSVSDYDNYIYYLQKSTGSLVTQGYNVEKETTLAMANELYQHMNTQPDSEDYDVVKPEEVELEKMEIDDTVLKMYFSPTYNMMEKSDEILYRAALVLTMTQLEKIEAVSIYSDSQPIMNVDGSIIGNLQASAFADLSGNNELLKSKISTLIYTPNEDGDKLISYTYDGTIESETSMEELIINQLIDVTIPKKVEVYSIDTRNGVCYVNFSDEFISRYFDMDDDVAIYSIVNSLCELTYVSKVRISVDGSSDVMFHDNISLNQTFLRNLDLVEVN